MEKVIWSILLGIISIPIYGVFIYTFINPKESFLFGRRWMYKDKDVEVSPSLIRYYKVMSVAAMIIYTIMLILYWI